MRYTVLMLFLLASMSTWADEEPNDKPDGAERISGRKTSALSSATDVDFFTFSIRKDSKNPDHDTSGNMTVNLSQKSPPGTQPKSGWRLDLYSGTDLGNSLYTAMLPETSLSVQFEQGLSPGTYYYKISSLDSEMAPTKEYTLKHTWEESKNYEKNPNDQPSTATPINLNEAYWGNLSTSKDADFYRFGLLNNDHIILTFQQDAPGANATIGWRVGLFSENSLSVPIQTADMPATTKSVVLEADLTIGVYYVRVIPLPQPEPTDTSGNSGDSGSTGDSGNSGSGDSSTTGSTNKPDSEKAPIGQRYQLTVKAVTFTGGNLCPLTMMYGQNPTTMHWTAFPSECDVPPGWFSTTIAPIDFDVCPAPRVVYSDVDKILTIPEVDVEMPPVTDPTTGETTTSTATLNNVKLYLLTNTPTFQFEYRP